PDELRQVAGAGPHAQRTPVADQWVGVAYADDHGPDRVAFGVHAAGQLTEGLAEAVDGVGGHSQFVVCQRFRRAATDMGTEHVVAAGVDVTPGACVAHGFEQVHGAREVGWHRIGEAQLQAVNAGEVQHRVDALYGTAHGRVVGKVTDHHFLAGLRLGRGHPVQEA